jgi:Uma2 family endonuclease
MTRPRTRNARDDDPREDHAVQLAASWRDYASLLRQRGESSSPRLTFADGVLEVMKPSADHEVISRAIASLVATYCEVHDIEYTGVGSWTLASRKLGIGLEPDECFVLGPRGSAKVPDLAVEVVWTAGRLDKLPLYLALGVREVWLWRRGAITAHRLRGERYQTSRRSALLAGVDLGELAACIDEPSTSAAVKRFRAHLRDRELDKALASGRAKPGVWKRLKRRIK